MKTLLLASVMLFGLFGSLASAPAPVPSPIPYFAFCRTLWLFAEPCAEISTPLTKQIQAFSPEYMLQSVTPLSIKANHTSPDGISIQNITLTFIPTTLVSGCRVSAQSMSLRATTLLDGGLNYCNLYKLLSASGLSSAPGFVELTNEWACLGYGLVKCK